MKKMLLFALPLMAMVSLHARKIMEMTETPFKNLSRVLLIWKVQTIRW